MPDFSIEAVNLTKKYGNFTALSDLNLKLEGTKCVGFLGPNGAGKTTTLKIFTDMVRATSGRALINGLDSHKDKKTALSSCGALIEVPEIYPSLTPREALTMIAEIRGVPSSERKSSITKVLEKVKMAEQMDKKVGKFSKGMKQRINIAAALIGDPHVLLLDEPTSGLDPRGMSEVREIIKDLKSESRLIFMSSHILSEVSEICDEVAMIDHGRLLAYGKINDIVSKFSGKDESVIEITVTKDLSTVTLNRIRALDGVSSVRALDPRRIDIKLVGGPSKQEKLLEKLVEMKIGLIVFRPAASALEETYLNMFKESV